MLLDRLYTSLTWNDAVGETDVIFVMAGRMERKAYGLWLYEGGIASRLVLSVGRFEVSKMNGLTPWIMDELVTLRDRTPPGERHFFLSIQTSGTLIERVSLVKWSTYGEVLALRGLLVQLRPGRLLIVSSSTHLRRVRLVCRKLLRGLNIEPTYCPVILPLSNLDADRWVNPKKDWPSVLTEWVKLIGYQVILSLPAPLAHDVMKLRP